MNALYGLHEALLMLREEGLENAWARHEQQHRALRAGLEKLGFEYIGRDGARLPQLNAVKVPDGVDEAKLRAMLLNDYNLEIGAGLGAWYRLYLNASWICASRSWTAAASCMSERQHPASPPTIESSRFGRSEGTVPISVVIVEKNEETNIGDALEGVRDFEDIVVVDAFSDDRTVEVFPKLYGQSLSA